MSEEQQQQPGGVKFVLLHHGACRGGPFHHRISTSGQCRAELTEADPGQHPRSIGVVLDGNFDAAPPATAQIEALQRLLLALKLRYPAIEVGGHRQVRGDPEATCPGRQFPLAALAAWARNELLQQRDSAQQRSLEAQYAAEPSAGEREGLAPRRKEPSAGEREGPAPRMGEPSAGEREEPSAGEREGLAPRMGEPAPRKKAPFDDA